MLAEQLASGPLSALYHQSPAWFASVSVAAVAEVAAADSAGWSAGVAASDSGDAAPSPTAFTARTLNRYSVLLTRLATAWRRAEPPPGIVFQVVSQAPAPVFLTYSQRMIAEPPSPCDLQPSATLRWPAAAVGLPGAGGAAAAGVAASDSGDAVPTPTAFTARTLNRCAVPLARPSTVWPVVEAPLFGTAIQSP